MGYALGLPAMGILYWSIGFGSWDFRPVIALGLVCGLIDSNLYIPR
jgi:hypothetical protein